MSEGSGGGHKSSGPALGPLSHKVGGQPAWVWIVGVVVLAIGVQFYRSRSAQAAAGGLAPTAVPFQDPATMGTGTLPAGAGTPTATAGPSQSTSEWLAAALKAVKNAGEDPLHALRALNAFLNGGDLSYADTLVVNAAVDAVGTPPGFTSIPPGKWADRNTPVPAGGTPPGGDATIARLLNVAGQSGIFAQYSDGTVRWIQDPNELSAIVNTTPALVNQSNHQAIITALPVSDPIWDRANYGVGGHDAYLAAGGGVSGGNGGVFYANHLI